MSDLYGIDIVMRIAMETYSHSARRSGRTTTLLHTVKTGDIVLFRTYEEARRFELLAAKEQDKTVVCWHCAPDDEARLYEKLYTSNFNAPGSNLYFDHGWIEQWYRRKIENLSVPLNNISKEWKARHALPTELPQEKWTNEQ